MNKVLKLDVWNLIFTVINLIVLYLLLKKFLIGPVTAIMEKRKALIEEGFVSARTAQQEADELKLKYELRMASAKEESEKIISRAKADARAVYDQTVTEADERAGKFMADARKNIEIERAKAIREMESEIAGLALDAAVKIAGKGTKEVDNLSLYDEFLAEAGEADDTDGN